LKTKILKNGTNANDLGVPLYRLQLHTQTQRGKAVGLFAAIFLFFTHGQRRKKDFRCNP